MHPRVRRARARFARGESFWAVVLTTGRSYFEIDQVRDTLGVRDLDWYRDIVATGDVTRVAQLWLYTPAGPCALKVLEPRSAYVLNHNLADLLTGRSRIAQIIGRVDDRETGEGVALIWDMPLQQMYKDEQASVLDFAPWRPGVARIGALNLHALGVQI